MRIPSLITAGDTAAWVDTAYADGLGASVNSGSYGLTYSLRGPIAAGNIDIVGTAQGTGWALALTSAQTAALNNTAANQTWYWQAFATKTLTRITAGVGTLLVKPNVAGLSTAAAYDGRSPAEQDLVAVRAEISARLAGGATLEYTIGQRSLKKEPMAALVAIEQRCVRIVARERQAAAAANGLGHKGRLTVRFA